MSKDFSVEDFDEYINVDIHGVGTVQIKVDVEGLVIDVYPYGADEPVATTYAWYDELFDIGAMA